MRERPCLITPALPVFVGCWAGRLVADVATSAARPPAIHNLALQQGHRRHPTPFLGPLRKTVMPHQAFFASCHVFARPAPRHVVACACVARLKSWFGFAIHHHSNATEHAWRLPRLRQPSVATVPQYPCLPPPEPCCSCCCHQLPEFALRRRRPPRLTPGDPTGVAHRPRAGAVAPPPSTARTPRQIPQGAPAMTASPPFASAPPPVLAKA